MPAPALQALEVHYLGTVLNDDKIRQRNIYAVLRTRPGDLFPIKTIPDIGNHRVAKTCSALKEDYEGKHKRCKVEQLNGGEMPPALLPPFL